MADPLSVAASIAGLVSIASEVAQICYSCYQFYRAAAKAPESLRQVIAELGLLRKVLSDLEGIYISKTENLPSVENVMSEVDHCRVEIEEFGKKLDSKSQDFRRAVVRLKWPSKEKDVKQFISHLQSYRATFDSAKSNDGLLLAMRNLTIAKETQNSLESEQSRRHVEEILNWLSPLDFGLRQDEIYSNRRQQGTSTWILREPAFKRWLDATRDSSKTTLFLKGDPGAGKTVLCSVVIRHLLSSHSAAAVAYVYCNHHEQGVQTSRHVLGSIAEQLAAKHNSLRSESIGFTLNRFYAEWKQRTVFQDVTMIDLIVEICGSLELPFVVVDGLDELEVNARNTVVALIKELRKRSIHVLISGRKYIFQTANLTTWLGNEIEVTAREEDIRAFVTAQVKQNEDLQIVIDGDGRWQAHLISEITAKSAGQFPLAYMHLKRIAEETCKADILLELNKSPTTLPDEYSRTLTRIKLSPPQCRLALRVLTWLIHAKTSLLIPELCEALAIDFADTRPRKDTKPHISMMLKSCHGFVVVDNTAGTVELFHFTVKEYLLSLPDIFAGVTVDIPRTCLTFLNYDAFNLPCEDNADCHDRRSRYAFAAYASSYWADHVRGPSEHQLESCLMEFLTNGNVFSMLQLLPAAMPVDPFHLGKDSDHNRIFSGDKLSMAIYMSVCFQLRITLRKLLDQKCNPNIIVPWGERYAPLHVAVSLGDEEMCNDLVIAGADLNVQDRWGLTPLHLSVSLQLPSRSKMVALLCTAGADCTITDQDGETAFMIAVDRADTESACLLLHHGSSVNVRNKNGVPALHHGLRRINVRDINEFVTKALAAGADCTITDPKGDTALMIAVERSDVESVRLLLRHGSDVNAQNKDGVTALHRALRRFDIDIKIIKELMANGADPTVIDWMGRSPFAVAIDVGYYSAVLLMMSSTDLNGSPYRLTEHDSEATEKFLAPLRRNDDVDLIQERQKMDSSYRTKNLAAKRISPMVRDRIEALYWAANKGDVETIHDLIVTVNDVNFVWDGRTGQTLLHVAAVRGRERVVWHLLAAGADASRKDCTGQTARECTEIPRIRYLLEDDNWLRHCGVVCTQKGNGKISGEKLRDFYGKRRREEIRLRWGGLLANSELQPEDFDSFECV